MLRNTTNDVAMDRNIIYAIKNLPIHPKKAFSEIWNRSFYSYRHNSSCSGVFKQVVAHKELIQDVIYTVECSHYYNGHLIHVLDNVSILAIDEHCLETPTFVQYDGKQLVTPHAVRLRSRDEEGRYRDRYCFCRTNCTECNCRIPESLTLESVAPEHRGDCECLLERRIITFDLEATLSRAHLYHTSEYSDSDDGYSSSETESGSWTDLSFSSESRF